MQNINDEIIKKKAQIESIKRRIEQSKSAGLDKFTKIDDILLQNQEILLDIKDTLITLNKISLSNLLIFQAMSKGEKIESIDIEKIKTEDITSLYDTLSLTKFVHLTNIATTADNERIYSIDGSGYIVEIVFLSSDSTTDNKSYSVKITAGNEIIVNDSFTNFETGSNYNTDITAFDDTNNSYYVLHIKDFFFKDNLIIELYDCDATFSEINIKYHV